MHFTDNPLVRELENNRKWTVSDNEKIPIDMIDLIYRNEVRGAIYQNELSLTDLPTVMNYCPDSYYTYYLNAIEDNIVCLDVEPTCPQEIKDKFLEMPYIYGETSMSGKGLHLFFRLPKESRLYTDAMKKKVMKPFENSQSKYWEILIAHYVTFTGKTLIPPENPQGDMKSFVSFFTETAEKQKTVIKKEIDFSKSLSFPIKDSDTIISQIKSRKFRKIPADYGNDMSKYEFGYIGFIHNQMNNVLDTLAIKKNKHEYTDNEKAYFIYETAKDLIPYRDKHDEERNGMPWLLYMTYDLLSRQVDNSSTRGKKD